MLKNRSVVKYYTGGYPQPTYQQYAPDMSGQSWGSAIGTGAKVGTALGTVIPGLGNVVGGIAGAAGGAMFKVGQATNNIDNKFLRNAARFALGPIGLAGSLIGKKKQEKYEREKAKYEQKVLDFENSAIENQTQGLLNTYNTQGNDIAYLANGGKMPYSIMDDGSRDLGDGMKLFTGPKHENGGIAIDSNSDMIQDAEVEGGEVYEERGKRIYSDRLKPESDILTMIKSNTGINVSGTYAQIAEKLGKIKGKLPEETSEAAKNTKELSEQKIEQSLDMLFENQEMTKPQDNNTQVMKNGGMLKRTGTPKYGIGFNGSKTSLFNNPVATTYDPFLNTNAPTNTYAPGTMMNNRSYITFMDRTAPTGGGFSNFMQGAGSKTMDFLGSDEGQNVIAQGANILNYFQNKKDLNKLKINQTPYLSASPRYSYTNTSGKAVSDINKSYRQGVQNIKNTSLQNKGANVASLKSAQINAINQVNNQEANRKLQADIAYNQRLGQTDQYNTGIINTTRQGNLERFNDKIALGIENRNALIQGILGNVQTSKMIKNDKAKALLTAAAQGDTGSLNRFLADYPELAKQLGLSQLIEQ